MMKRLAVEIGRSVVGPLGRRLGTALAAYLLAQGIPQDMADQFLLALGVAGGLAVDIVAAYVTDKRRAG